MRVSEIFEGTLRRIEREEFLNALREHDASRQPVDLFAGNVFRKIKAYRNGNFYVGSLSEVGLSRLIVPWHDHGSGLVPQGGWPLQKAVEKYRKRVSADGECFAKIARLAKEFDLSKCGVLIASPDRELVHPGHYWDHGPDSVYSGNGFHRSLRSDWRETNRSGKPSIYFIEAG